MPNILKHELSPIIIELLEVIRYQSEAIQILKNEIAVLKGDKKAPKIKPSKLAKTVDKEKESEGKKKLKKDQVLKN